MELKHRKNCKYCPGSFFGAELHLILTNIQSGFSCIIIFVAALADLYLPLSVSDCSEFRALKTKPDQTYLTYLPDWLS